jgi:hypothetical protein
LQAGLACIFRRLGLRNADRGRELRIICGLGRDVAIPIAPAALEAPNECASHFMIIGSGLLAKAFSPRFQASPEVWIYAAGVSNSGCVDSREFERERLRLGDALRRGEAADAFVYFSTCSVGDPKSEQSRYVRHKRDMEALVSSHRRHLVVRLPQVCGRTPNPHTLLNYLHARISRSESFPVWIHATRNVIDVDDVAEIVAELVTDPALRGVVVNVANPKSHPILEIVAAMERAVGKPAVAQMVDDGAPYAIDTSAIEPVIRRLGLSFDDEYVLRVARKYYGEAARA